jgi:uncharacterized protein with FMN-binding domain
MKKYLQITFVLGVFGLLVLLRQVKGDSQPVVVQKSNNQIPTQQPSSSVGQNMMQSQQKPMMSAYKNGTYNGSVEDAFYGMVQVQVVVLGGKITSVNFLQYPNDNRTSQFVNSQAMPMLQQEAIQAQSAQVNGVSGASATSQAFQVSLANALAQAK